jgi:Mycothiol maleylpyruvate isomerase N-terminal domain
MSARRQIFLDSAAQALSLLASEEVAGRWDEPSVLATYEVSTLVGHLLRGISTVQTYLAEPEPEEPSISAGEYFARLAPGVDPGSSANRSIRERSVEAAAGGPAATAARGAALLESLRRELASTAATRRVRVAGGLVMLLDDYLAARVVKLVVHGDDLALSCGIDFEPGADATALATWTLVEVARLRHGELAVVRALARRERDAVEALRVL